MAKEEGVRGRRNVMHRRGFGRLARAALACALACAFVPACVSNDRAKQPNPPDAEVAKDAPEITGDDASVLVRTTHRNVQHYQTLLAQGQAREALAMHQTVGRAVDDNFATFRAKALDRSSLTVRNMAVTCLGFSLQRRAQARDLLLSLLEDDEPWIMANAALGLGVLKDPDTNLTRLIQMCTRGDAELRTSAASALKELFLVKETPRELTPQYWAAVDALVALLHDTANSRGRRAAVWGLGNLRHPATLDHLIGALKDKDEMVQIGALRGIELLGDQRALDALLDYLDGSPTTSAQSYARRALVAIALQGGFAKTPSELEPLETNPKLWRDWFRSRRMR